MIELLLQAERALSMGLVDQAERLYRQAAEADPRNSIAVVGLARVALERDDDVLAWREAKRALTIDPENAAAQRMVERFEEVWRHRGQPVPAGAADSTAQAPAASPAGTAAESLVPAEAQEAWERITGVPATPPTGEARAPGAASTADASGSLDSDLRPDIETGPEDTTGRAADDGFPVAEDEAHDAAAAEARGAHPGDATGEWPPAEAESAHLSTLPGLDRVRHLFTRKRE